MATRDQDNIMGAFVLSERRSKTKPIDKNPEEQWKREKNKAENNYWFTYFLLFHLFFLSDAQFRKRHIYSFYTHILRHIHSYTLMYESYMNVWILLVYYICHVSHKRSTTLTFLQERHWGLPAISNMKSVFLPRWFPFCPGRPSSSLDKQLCNRDSSQQITII